MARLILSLRKNLHPMSSSLFSPPSSFSSKSLILQLQQQHQPLLAQQNHNSSFLFQSIRHYISDMRKSAFDGNILRLLRSEIQYELDRSPPSKPVAQFGPFSIDDRPGEQWIKLKREYGSDEDIKIEATMFDGSRKSKEVNAVGENLVDLHISMVVTITKGGEGSYELLEFVCSAWPEHIEIDQASFCKGQKILPRTYTGPEFKELDNKLQLALYEFLEERGIDEDLVEFLHEYMKNKHKTEFIRWIETVKGFIEGK